MIKNNTTIMKNKPFICFSTLYTNFIQTNMSLGHNSLKLQKSWHKQLSKFCLGTRNKTTILNYKFALNCLIKAIYVFATIIKCNGNVLIVNTNPELSKLIYHIKKNTQYNYLFFSDCGWTKGTLTNWKQVYGKIKTFTTFHHNFDTFLNENNIHFPNYKKMKKSYKGFLNQTIGLQGSNLQHNTNFFFEKKKLLLDRKTKTIFGKNYAESFETISPLPTNRRLVGNAKKQQVHAWNFSLNWKPDIVILMSTDNAESIINEASSTNTPVIAFLDSNSDTRNITYPIPINTYYYCFVWFFFNCLTKINNKHYCTKTK